MLRQAELVREERRGRHRYYHLAAGSLGGVREWLEPFEEYWRERLQDLAELEIPDEQ